MQAIFMIEFFALHHRKEELKTVNLSGSTSPNSQKQPSYRVFKFQTTISTDLKISKENLKIPIYTALVFPFEAKKNRTLLTWYVVAIFLPNHTSFWHFVAEFLPYIPHTCYFGSQLCTTVALDCNKYTRLRTCCCDTFLRQKCTLTVCLFRLIIDFSLIIYRAGKIRIQPFCAEQYKFVDFFVFSNHNLLNLTRKCMYYLNCFD